MASCASGLAGGLTCTFEFRGLDYVTLEEVGDMEHHDFEKYHGNVACSKAH
jgi:hypothetical protein